MVLGCSLGPPPDESQFSRDVALMMLEGAIQSLAVDGVDTPKTMVFDEESIPSSLRDVEAGLKRAFDEANIAWIAVEGSAFASLRRTSDARYDSTFRINQSHTVVRLEVTGEGRERQVSWSYACGPMCGGGDMVRMDWTGDTWDQRVVGGIRY